MIRNARTSPEKATAASPPGDATPQEGPRQTIVERPDGFYWIGPRDEDQVGPYETYELAVAARDAASDEALAPGEALRAAEREIGIADWLDAETGEPAEGREPRLPEE